MPDPRAPSLLSIYRAHQARLGEQMSKADNIDQVVADVLEREFSLLRQEFAQLRDREADRLLARHCLDSLEAATIAGMKAVVVDVGFREPTAAAVTGQTVSPAARWVVVLRVAQVVTAAAIVIVLIVQGGGLGVAGLVLFGLFVTVGIARAAAHVPGSVVLQAFAGMVGALVGGKLGKQLAHAVGSVGIWVGRATGWILGGGLFNAIAGSGARAQPELLKVSRVNGEILVERLYAALESAQAAVRVHEQNAGGLPPPPTPAALLSFLQRLVGAARLGNTDRLIRTAEDHLDEVLDALRLTAEDYRPANDGGRNRAFTPVYDNTSTASVTLWPALFQGDKLVLEGQVLLPTREKS